MPTQLSRSAALCTVPLILARRRRQASAAKPPPPLSCRTTSTGPPLLAWPLPACLPACVALPALSPAAAASFLRPPRRPRVVQCCSAGAAAAAGAAAKAVPQGRARRTCTLVDRQRSIHLSPSSADTILRSRNTLRYIFARQAKITRAEKWGHPPTAHCRALEVGGSLDGATVPLACPPPLKQLMDDRPLRVNCASPCLPSLRSRYPCARVWLGCSRRNALDKQAMHVARALVVRSGPALYLCLSPVPLSVTVATRRFEVFDGSARQCCCCCRGSACRDGCCCLRLSEGGPAAA